MTIIKLKEEGKFIGVARGFGYIYLLNNCYYSIGTEGLKQL